MHTVLVAKYRGQKRKSVDDPKTFISTTPRKTCTFPQGIHGDPNKNCPAKDSLVSVYMQLFTARISNSVHSSDSFQCNTNIFHPHLQSAKRGLNTSANPQPTPPHGIFSLYSQQLLK